MSDDQVIAMPTLMLSDSSLSGEKMVNAMRSGIRLVLPRPCGFCSSIWMAGDQINWCVSNGDEVSKMVTLLCQIHGVLGKPFITPTVRMG